MSGFVQRGIQGAAREPRPSLYPGLHARTRGATADGATKVAPYERMMRDGAPEVAPYERVVRDGAPEVAPYGEDGAATGRRG